MHLQLMVRKHRLFITILVLFGVFRLLAILLLRPGGYISDASDYDFYALWGQVEAMGYRTFENLWTAYPPLFPALMLPVFELASRVPPWVEPRLAFHFLFGLELLFFECGNLILIYRLARKLENAEHRTQNGEQGMEGWAGELPSGVGAVVFYALLFTPVYTLLGWFEAMPLFFLLLGLDLLVSGSRWGWIGSAVAAALGFLTKLTPMMLVPVAVRWLGAKLNWRAVRDEWFNPRSPGNLLWPALYCLAFVGVVAGLGYWLVGGNLTLAFSSLRVNAIRPPWQSLWAVLDGYYGYGLVPVDMRNLVGLERNHWESRLPWPWITAGFGLLYLWLYTRRYDWSSVRTPVVFTGVSLLWLFLYSKGWSPQFLVWVLAFIVLLLPTFFGVVLACVLSVVNVIESHLYLVLLPDEQGLLVGTVLVRTALFVLLMVEFLGQIWPAPATATQLRRISTQVAWLVIVGAVVAGLAATPRAAQAYQTRRLAEHPCREAISFLLAQTDRPASLVVSDQLEIWRDFYPWLRNRYTIRIIDGYNPQDRPWAEVVAERLDEVAGDQEFWWIERPEPPSQAGLYFAQPGVHTVEERQLGTCLLKRVARTGGSALEREPAGDTVNPFRTRFSSAQVGADFRLMLYWQTATTGGGLPTAGSTDFDRMIYA